MNDKNIKKFKLLMMFGTVFALSAGIISINLAKENGFNKILLNDVKDIQPKDTEGASSSGDDVSEISKKDKGENEDSVSNEDNISDEDNISKIKEMQPRGFNQLVNNNEKNLVIRSSTSSSYSQIGSLPVNKVATITGESSKFWNVKYGSINGYILKSVSLPIDSTFPNKVKNTSSSNVNIRSSNSTTGTTVVGSIPSGAVGEAIDYRDGWFKIIYNGIVGWVSGSYVKYAIEPAGTKLPLTSGDLNTNIYARDASVNNNIYTSNYIKDSAGRHLYCLELNKDAPTGHSYTKGSMLNDQSYRVMQNGYPNKSFTGDVNTDRIITQIALWAIVSPDIIDINSISMYKDGVANSTLLTHVKNLYNIGKNGGQTQNVSINFSTTAINANSSNGYLETGYMTIGSLGDGITSSNINLKFFNQATGAALSGISIIKEDNTSTSSVSIGQKFKLRIPTSMSGIKIKVQASGNVTHTVAYRYKSNLAGVQDVAGLENITENKNSTNNLVVTCAELTGNLRVVKKNENNSLLSGAKFKLQLNGVDVKSELTTNSNGEVIFYNVPQGTYTLVETAPPTGYVINDNNYSVVVSAGATNTKTVYNTTLKGNIQVTNYITNTSNKIGGAEFTLYDSSNNKVSSAVANSDGVVTFSNIHYGSYYIKQTKAPVGYVLATDKKTVSITANGSTYKVSFYNDHIKGNIHITKTDYLNTDRKISGAEFKLYDSSGTHIGTATTDSTGIARFENIKYGQYSVKESKPPTGYSLSSETKSFNITTNGATYVGSFKNDRLRDYSISAYNIKDSSNALQGTLRKGKAYSLNIELLNNYYNLNLPSNATLGNGKIDKVVYAIAVNDGTSNQNISDITTSNIKGEVIAKGSFSDIAIKDKSSVWKNIKFSVPDNDKWCELVFVAELSSSGDQYSGNNKLVAKLPILNAVVPKVNIDDVMISSNSGNVFIGSDVSIKSNFSINTLKTYEGVAKIKITYPGGSYTEEKVVYGLSGEHPSTAYFKFSPKTTGTHTVTVSIETSDSKKTSVAKTFNVIDVKHPSYYETISKKTSITHNASASIVTYLRVDKRDKDAVSVRYCSAKNCQKDSDNNLTCPGHEYWDWGNWYETYIPAKSTSMNGIKEEFNIKSVKFKSKTTENNKDKFNQIDGEGMVELLDSSAAKYGVLKSGYGFDLVVRTEYSNNLPAIYNNAYISNTIPANTTWAQYRSKSYSGSKVPFIYSSNNNKSVDDQVKNVTGAVELAVPSLDDLIIENPNQLYIKTPDGKYLISDEGFETNYDNKVNNLLSMTDSSRTTIDSTSFKTVKEFEFKEIVNESENARGYYTGENVADGEYPIVIFNRFSGYGNNQNTMLHDVVSPKIIVKGSRYDDIIDN